MLMKFQATQAGWAIALLRILLGVIFIKEGSGKLLGWFGGGGFAAAVAYFTEMGIPLPAFSTFLVSSVEFLGGLCFLSGFLTRIAAIPIMVTTSIAILTAHLGGGWQYPVLIIASSLVLFKEGAGPFSLDRALGNR